MCGLELLYKHIVKSIVNLMLQIYTLIISMFLFIERIEMVYVKCCLLAVL